MHIHYLQHVFFEGPAAIADWARSKGHTISGTHLYKNDPLPQTNSYDFFVILGGPMNIYEENLYPWLIEEKIFIKDAVKNQKKVLGICLGAQLISDVLGGKVYKNAHKEIGWLPIEFTQEIRVQKMMPFLPAHLTVYHWHGDTFELPDGVVRIGQSEACRNQGFLYNNHVLALQFHLESTPESVRALIDNCHNEIVSGTYIQSSEEMLTSGPEHFKKINKTMFAILDNL